MHTIVQLPEDFAEDEATAIRAAKAIVSRRLAAVSSLSTYAGSLGLPANRSRA